MLLQYQIKAQAYSGFLPFLNEKQISPLGLFCFLPLWYNFQSKVVIILSRFSMFSKIIARYKPYRRKHGSSRYWNLAHDRRYYKALGEPPVEYLLAGNLFLISDGGGRKKPKAKKETGKHIKTDTNMIIERSLAENEKSILVPMCR